LYYQTLARITAGEKIHFKTTAYNSGKTPASGVSEVSRSVFVPVGTSEDTAHANALVSAPHDILVGKLIKSTIALTALIF
jgi:hypothetical protein